MILDIHIWISVWIIQATEKWSAARECEELFQRLTTFRRGGRLLKEQNRSEVTLIRFTIKRKQTNYKAIFMKSNNKQLDGINQSILSAHLQPSKHNPASCSTWKPFQNNLCIRGGTLNYQLSLKMEDKTFARRYRTGIPLPANQSSNRWQK